MNRILLALALSTALAAQTPSGQSRVGVLHVQGNVYLIYGAGSNITMQVGDQAVVLVDAGPASMSAEVMKAIRSVSQRPIGYIINTSYDRDHTGGNANLAKGGFYFLATVHGSPQQAAIVSHLKVLDRMSADGSGAPHPDWPTETYEDEGWHLYANDEPIILEHAVNAHTDGDSVVFFRRSDVVITGDLFDMTRYPVIDEKAGGSLAGILKEINHILKDVAIPKENEEGGTYIIPGHGRVCDRNDLANYRDMLTIIRDRIQDLVKKGATLDQVIKANPTFDYDGGYGVDQGPWTTNMFVAAVYRELKK
ncbi:MAG: MBL fold metallo-hydrolase [Bryobacteraceae bacterium]|jgi:glyoxylase-like metal-dependent hydrolase (beta-lactamase superfamily II)